MVQTPNQAALTNDSTPNPTAPAPVPTPVPVTAVADEWPAAGTPPCDLSDLTISQCKALETLVAGRSLAEAARDADVDPGTLYRWRKKDPRFIVALNAWRLEAKSGTCDRVLALGDEATRAAYRLLRSNNPSVVIAILKACGAFEKLAPATTDIDEATDALRKAQRESAEAHRKRLWKEAEAIRGDAEAAVWRKQGTERKLAETRALSGKKPESVLRELRRADELEVEADGLLTADDVVPQPPPASNPVQKPAGK